MAFVDVSEVLSDPDFADALACERSRQLVGNDGIAVNSARVIPFTGVVTNDAGDRLERHAAGERITGSITVHTHFRLVAGEPGITADIVRARGRRYTVTAVSDYSHMGRGFNAATCELIPLSG